MNTRTWTVCIMLAAILATACTAGPNPSTDTARAGAEVAGFWLGLWHGLICPISFIVSLFSDTVRVYEVHNTGGWYDFGFLVGASSALGGGGVGAARSRR